MDLNGLYRTSPRWLPSPNGVPAIPLQEQPRLPRRTFFVSTEAKVARNTRRDMSSLRRRIRDVRTQLVTGITLARS